MTTEVRAVPDRISLIKGQSCFAELSDTDLAELSELWEACAFNADDVIVTEGDFVDSVFVIVSGQVDVRHVRVKQGALSVESLATLGPGQAIGLGEHGFYSLSGRRSATVVALESVQTLRLRVPVFNGFAMMHPQVKKMMAQARQFAV